MHVDKDSFFASYRSPTITSQQPSVPLVMIGNAHPNCQYIWKCLDRQELLFPDSPVIFVKLAAVYKGAVFVEGNQVCSTVFDVCQSLTGER